MSPETPPARLVAGEVWDSPPSRHVRYQLALDTQCACGRIVGYWLRLVIERSPQVADWPVRRAAAALRCGRCGSRPVRVRLLDPVEHAPLTRPPDVWVVDLVP